MEDSKKRKLEESSSGNGENGPKEDIRLLIEPLTKPQLVDLLAKLGSQYPSVAEEIKSIASADPVHRKLFVRGLAWNTTSETLRAAFQEHGEIEEGAVIYDKATGKSRGYGFITYKNMESAQNALRAPSKLIDARLAVCNLACEGLSGTSSSSSSSSSAPDLALRKLYIGSLSPEVTTEMLLNYFSRHGEIEEGSVAYDKDSNESRGFGFVTYKTAEAAKKAIDDPEKTLGGRNIIAKYADSHKGKAGQPPFTAAVVPMAAVPMTPGYVQPGQPPVGYIYPQTVAPYLAAPYPSAPTAPSPYPTLGQAPYPSVAAKKDQYGFPTQPGRNIIAKYADSHKGKAGQPPFTAAVVPMAAVPMTPGYVQPGQPPVGYIYPQTVAPYLAAPYPSAPTAPSPYPTLGQAPYPSVAAKKDQYGFPTQPVGMNIYPYYYSKQ